MNSNSEVIFSLCSHLLPNYIVEPYKFSEWSKLAEKLFCAKISPSEILSFTEYDYKNILNINPDEIYRIRYLLERKESLKSELEKYKEMGINIITRADAEYPRNLKIKLGKSCPPMFYYAGNIQFLNKKSIGFVGSRNINDNDITITENIVRKINAQGYGIVSGGARGIDSVSSVTSIRNGSTSIEYIADSLTEKIRIKSNIKALQNNQLLILTAFNPNASFTVAGAMMRNNYIYAQSYITVVIKSDYKKGGTWNGASNCIKRKTSPVLCYNLTDCKGNQELIKLGAISIDESWDENINNYLSKKTEEPLQLSLFEN